MLISEQSKRSLGLGIKLLKESQILFDMCFMALNSLMLMPLVRSGTGRAPSMGDLSLAFRGQKEVRVFLHWQILK